MSIRQERQLVLVGKKGWRCEEDIEEITAAQKAGENVIWLNNIESRDTLRLLYAGAGAFIFPSLHEGYGIPILEAFACRVPVACSDTSSLPEVADGAAIEFNPSNIASIAEAMIRTVEDIDTCVEHIALGHARASALSWGNTAKLTACVYRELA